MLKNFLVVSTIFISHMALAQTPKFDCGSKKEIYNCQYRPRSVVTTRDQQIAEQLGRFNLKKIKVCRTEAEQDYLMIQDSNLNVEEGVVTQTTENADKSIFLLQQKKDDVLTQFFLVAMKNDEKDIDGANAGITVRIKKGKKDPQYLLIKYFCEAPPKKEEEPK